MYIHNLYLHGNTDHAPDGRYPIPSGTQRRRRVKAPTLKRVYEAPSADDGTRILVDRLWPRGIAKHAARIDLWLKDIAPSHGLRKRFHGKPDDWQAFRAAYFAELAGTAAQAAARDLLDRLRRGPVTLLYAARDTRRNNAVALKSWLAAAQRRSAPGMPVSRRRARPRRASPAGARSGA